MGRTSSRFRRRRHRRRSTKIHQFVELVRLQPLNY